MSTNYAYKTRDLKFILKEWLPTHEIFAYDKHKDVYNVDDIDPIIDSIDKVAREVIAPTADDGEKPRSALKMERSIFLNLLKRCSNI